MKNICTSAQLPQNEAQLLQRSRAIIRVTEYFAKSLKVSQGH